MRFLFKFILVAIFLVGSFFIFQVLPKAVLVSPIAPKEIIIGQTKFEVEVADTPSSQAKGLSGHRPLLENTGMLFIFSQLTMPGFWMKDMNFPLDIVWISGGKVVDILENLAPDDSPNRKVYYPKQMIDGVLEVAAGSVLKNNIKIGDDVK